MVKAASEMMRGMTQSESSEVERVHAAWERIERWYAENAPEWELPGGTSDADIDELEQQLDVTFPAAFRASLLRHDGIPDPWWPQGELESVEGIRSSWESWTNLLEDGSFDEANGFVEDNPALKRSWWWRGWVPIDRDGASNGACLDLDPGPAGRVGQVIDMDHEVGPSGPHYEDFAAYLEETAEALEDGYYIVNDDQLDEYCEE
ncbi:protein involved in beta-1,3-glucan synthesis (plasmid) [Deinococcus peraridilitoris DSM 19664]|uniref:Protein involved in beta-1,3-glucan synthesis n=2 Tax=Deinococcus TaxID=1298 RepID=L0A9E0_DEIPD|nr:protein involved in beta-1,3-glucan synthesis [Deinococcus peraridilitoris DSM 19664]